MKNPKFPPYKPDIDPNNIPHYPDWPYAPHADWPHGGSRRFNDSERAVVVPHPVDCCHPDDNECLCVTSGDMELWNSYSGLSGLTAFDASALSAMYDMLQGMDNYSAVEDAYYQMSANSAIWNSAAYIPNVYENLSALYDNLNDKADYSAISAYCDIGKHPDGTYGDRAIKIWTDSLKDYYYGDRTPHDMTIVGDGTLERPLRVGKPLIDAIMAVQEVISAGLADQNDITKLINEIKNINITDNTQNNVLHRHDEYIEWIINQLGKAPSGSLWIQTTKNAILEESRNNPASFYYCGV